MKTPAAACTSTSTSGRRNSPFAPFTWVTERPRAPNFQAFGWFTLISEMLLAALLLIGLRTRVVALAGAAMAVPIVLSVLYYDRRRRVVVVVPADDRRCTCCCGRAPSGEHLGVDGVLANGDGRSAARSCDDVGIVAVVIGVARTVRRPLGGLRGRGAALLGSDAGFVDDGRAWCGVGS